MGEKEPIVSRVSIPSNGTHFGQTFLIQRNQNRSDDVVFKSVYTVGVGFQFELIGGSLEQGVLSDLTIEQVKFILKRKPGMCGNVQVLHNYIEGIVRIDNTDMCGPCNGVSLPMVCYDKLCKAICHSLPCRQMFEV